MQFIEPEKRIRALTPILPHTHGPVVVAVVLESADGEGSRAIEVGGGVHVDVR